MADINKQINNLIKKIEKLPEVIDEYSKTNAFKEMAQLIVDGIVKRTRLGDSVKKFDGPSEKFAELAKSTIEQRKKYKKNLKKFGKKTTSTTRSNLTATGEMLDSMKWKAKGSEITIYLDGDHEKTLNGKTPSKKIKNSDLAKYMENGDSSRNRPPRPFFNMSKTEVDLIRKQIASDIRKLIRRK